MYRPGLKDRENGGRNRKLDLAEFIDTGPLSGEFRFNTEAPEVWLVGWHLSKDGPLKRSPLSLG